MMTTSYGVSASVIASVFVLSIVLVFIISGDLSSLMCFDTWKSEFTVPIVLLQTKITGASNEFRAVSSERSNATTGFSVNSRFRNRTVIREEVRGSEQGLARARAAIRKAASSGKLSSNVRDHGDELAGDIYRNPGAFYQ
ncbi:uncharacterized protein LOC114305383 [Camellia sinensis]|uniref:uncharacterized protein LOC114305383 n=1 Tax=Camellia sinensis TaxID=4442 RepID=UPI001036658E|nr:uncharacterized protein LOC114305383 [Camellia sinensis]